MKSIPLFRHCTAFLIVAVVTLTAQANVQLTGNYTQDFTTMGAAGTATPADWFVGGRSGTDGLVDASGNGAITGTAVQVDNGSVSAPSGTVGNYNYGPTGSTSRSLGSAATTALGHRAMEVRIDNQMGFSIAAFEIRYDGKQWRLENANNQVLVLKYSTDGVNFVNLGSSFDFNSIQDTGTAGPLDGNTVRLNGIGGIYRPATPIPNGSTFYLRWFDLNDASFTDHGLAID